MKNKPFFSIITPSFNQGQFIEETIKSVFNQTFQDFEHIVVDGGSTDNTLKILKKYKAKYPDKFFYISEKDKGQSDAINKGMKMAKGEVLTWLNSDDYYPEYTLEEVYKVFNEKKDVFWLSGDYIVVNENGKKIHSFVKYYKRFLRLLPFNPTIYIANFINQPSTFFRKEIIKQVGYLNINYRYNMDYDYWLRMFTKGYKNFYLNKELSFFRIHSKSKSGYQYKEMFKEDLEVLKKYKNNLLFLFHKLHNLLILLIYKLIKN